MTIAIIGSGNMAQAIGSRVAGTNHTLTIYDREPGKAKALVEKLGAAVQSKSLSEPIEGDVVILALPYNAIPEVINAHKAELSGKVLVDISNPVDFNSFQLIPPPGTAGAQEIAKILPEGAKLVKAFNTIFAGTLAKGEVDGKPLDVFIAGDDQEAKDKLKEVVQDSGLRPIDAGPLAQARHLEGFQLIHMMVQEQLGSNWLSAIKIIH